MSKDGRFGRMLAVVAGLALTFACRAPEAHQPSPIRRLLGAVHSPTGFATGGSIVIATDLVTNEEIATTFVKPDGTFALDLVAKKLALTVANRREWGYLSQVDVDEYHVDIQMSSKCSTLQAQLEFEGDVVPHLDFVRIARFSDDVGDTFGAAVDDARRFVVCLPNADYQITLPPELASRFIVVSLPAPNPVHIRDVTQQCAAMPLRGALGIAPASQDEFIGKLPSAVQLLGLGESNHGTREFTLERTSLMIALARQRGFTAVLIEAGFGEMLAANAYVHGAPIDVDSAVRRTSVWVWKTEEIRRALEAFRVYNQTVTPDHQISVFGVDIQHSAGALDDLLSMNIGLTSEEAALLGRLRDHDAAAWAKFTASERAIVRRALERIASLQGHEGLASGRTRHALCARSLLFLLDVVDAPSSWQKQRIRDHAMAELGLALFHIEPELRATMWAHLGHVSREDTIGVRTLGSYLSSSLGERYRAYGLLAYAGAARAWELSQAGAIAHSLTTAPTFALEGALASGAPVGLPEISYWSFGDRAGRSPWLNELHWVRAFGSTYPGDARSYRLYDLGAIDGAVLFKTVTPSRAVSAPAPSP